MFHPARPQRAKAEEVRTKLRLTRSLDHLRADRYFASSIFAIEALSDARTKAAVFFSLRLAGPGDPAAPKTFCLPLLPSGPGGVYRVLLHRAQPLARKVFIPSPQFVGLRVEQALYGGEGGIRTHGPVAGTHAFQACRFVHSRTSPRRLSRDES